MEISDWLWSFLHSPDYKKYAVFWMTLLGVVPIVTLLCCMRRNIMYFVFFLMVWSICDPENLGISFFSEPTYRAAIRGFDVYFADLMGVVLLLAMLWHHRVYRLRWILPLTIPFLLFFLVGALSWWFAVDYLVVPGSRRLDQITVYAPHFNYFSTKWYPCYELWRLLRGFFLFWITANFVRDRKALYVFCGAIVATAVYLICVALRDRYAFGIYRVAATLVHPNDFAVYCSMLGAVLFAVALQVRNSIHSIVMLLLGVGLLGCVMMTVSRSALVVYGFVAIAPLFVILPRYFSTRNLTFLGVGVVLSMIGFLVAWDTLESRFIGHASIAASMNERVLFNEQGVLMAREHPLGVGLGNFSAWSWEEYAEKVSKNIEAGVPAHNIWFLTLGEVGWIGLAVFALLWLRIYHVGYLAWRREKDKRLDGFGFEYTLAVALIIATLSLHLQSLLHFSYRAGAVYHLLQVMLGVLVALYLRLNAKALRNMGSGLTL